MKKYDIAFSYASEQKDIIEKYSNKFRSLGLDIFIDTEHPDLFVFKHVPDTLKQIYDDDEIVMLVFLSKDYAKKDFTKYEGHIAFDRLLKEKRLAIIKLDDSSLSWLPSSFFYFDVKKYTFDEICQSIYKAITKYSLPTISTLFKNINEFLLKNIKCLKLCLNTNTCIKFRIEDLGNTTIKISLNNDLQRILLFLYDISNTDSTFPVAEIYISEKSIVFENKGISDALELITKYTNEDEIKNELLKLLNNLLEKKYD